MDRQRRSYKHSTFSFQDLNQPSSEGKTIPRLSPIKLQSNLKLPILKSINNNAPNLDPISERVDNQIKHTESKLKRNQSVALFLKNKSESNNTLLSPKFKMQSIKLP